jgi:hypothetical protein
MPSSSRKSSQPCNPLHGSQFILYLQNYCGRRQYCHDHRRYSTYRSSRTEKAPPPWGCWNVNLRIPRSDRGCYCRPSCANSRRRCGELGRTTSFDCVHLHVGCPVCRANMVIQGLLCSYIAFYAISWGPVIWVLTGELFVSFLPLCFLC